MAGFMGLTSNNTQKVREWSSSNLRGTAHVRRSVARESKLAERRCARELSADVDHGARGLEEAGFADVVAGLFAVDRLSNVGG